MIASDRAALRDLQYDVEQFLYREADLIDERRFDDWLKLLADDLEYWMPVRSTRALGDEGNEFAKPGESALFDDDKESMHQRVRKLHTGYSWAEDPPSRTRHVVSNVRIESMTNDLVEVRCNFMLYRSRLAADEDLWVGRREDRLRRSGESFLIARRHIYLDQVSLSSKNLSVFF
ncbi:MAG: 3-phenylpropionate/cinnamic acid dioxygenase subunit beta [Candidatus Lustribacter sp.]